MKQIKEGYKQTKVGIIPQDWEVERIDNILKRIRKKVEVEKDESYYQIGIRSHGKGIFYKKPVSGEELGNKSVFWIEPDSFIVNIVFAWEQAIARTTNNEMGMIASYRFPMYQPKNKKVNIDYIVYLFKSPRGKYYLELASPGGAGRNKTLGQNEFAELKIPLPPLKEQEKIAEILTTWDNAIIKQQELIKSKEEQKKGLMQKLLSGEVRFDGFADEWEESKLGDIGKFYKGKGISKDEITEQGTPCLRYGELYTVYGEKIDQVISKTDLDLKELFLSNKNDIIIPASGETAIDIATASCVLHDNIALGSDLNVIRTEQNGIFLSYYLNVIGKKKIAAIAQGVSVVHLYSSQLKSLVLRLPSLLEQQKIAKVLSLADEEINNLKNELKEQKQQKKALMQKLLTGQVRVKV